MVTRKNTILLTLFGIFLGGLLGYLSPTLKKANIDVEFWSYTPSIIIALCALVVTVWQLKSSIKHNKLNMTPRLQVQVSNLIDEIAKTDDLFEIKIINNGLGPAEIKAAYFEYTHDNKKIQFNLDSAGMLNYLITAFKDDTTYPTLESKLKARLIDIPMKYPYRKVECLAKNQLISANESINLMKLSIPYLNEMTLSEEDKQKMRIKAKKAMNDTKIVLHYDSLYGDSLSLSVKLPEI